MLFIIYLFFIFIPLCVCVCVSFDVCVYVFRSELISRMETTRECMGPMPTSGLVGCCLDNTHPTNHPPKRVVMETSRDIYIGSRTRAPELFQSIGHWARWATRRRIKSGPAAVGPTSCGTNKEIALLLVSLFFLFFPPFVYVFLSLFLSLARLHYCVSTANIQQPAKSQQQQQSRDQPSWKILKKKERKRRKWIPDVELVCVDRNTCRKLVK